MSVEAATQALAAAKTAHKADKANKELKAAYKAAKAALATAQAAAEAKAAKKAAKKSKKKNKRKAETDITEDAPVKKVKEAPVEAKVDVAALQAAAKAAKAAYKADKSNAGLKAAHKAAKAALAAAEAGATAAPAEAAPAATEAEDPLAGLKKKKVEEAPAAAGGNDHEGNPPSEKCFCGNLSFDIDDDSAKEWFADCGTITDIYWLEDKESGRFKGCGFLTFSSLEESAKAVAKHGQDCMGREIRINYAQNRGGAKKGGGGGKGGAPRPLSEKPEGCTTVFAGNLSYDIDDDKMAEFAKDCGDIKNIRWLTDRDSGDFKGCGFVEFYDGAAVDKFVLKNGEDCLGRSIRLDYAAPRKPKEW